MSSQRKLLSLVVILIAVTLPVPAGPALASGGPDVTELVTGLRGGSGSTIGPDGALYVTEGVVGKILRVDPKTGESSIFATGLPKAVIELGGAMDVAFIRKTAYVLVTLVGADVGGSATVGIYRVDGPDTFTVIADIGAFSLANPPETPFFLATGVQYALQPYRGGFLVTDGHHNRVLRVTLDGEVTELIAFGNIVPTGLAVRGGKVFMAEAGPVPHLPRDGKIMSFRPRRPAPREVASGAPLLVDVELGRGGALYALSQGVGVVGAPDGSPAAPNTGKLVKATGDGTFAVLVDGLDRPTSLELVKGTAYVVTLTGTILRIDGI